MLNKSKVSDVTFQNIQNISSKTKGILYQDASNSDRFPIADVPEQHRSVCLQRNYINTHLESRFPKNSVIDSP